jgi:hypothetical protein
MAETVPTSDRHFQPLGQGWVRLYCGAVGCALCTPMPCPSCGLEEITIEGDRRVRCLVCGTIGTWPLGKEAG